MNRRIAHYLIWGVGALVAATLAVVLLVPDIEVRFTEDQVRDAIEERLPLEKQSSELRLEVTDADVDFVGTGEKGSVAIGVDVEASGFGLAGKGAVETQSAVRYEDGAFYLSDLRLDDLELKPTLATKAKMAALKKVWDTFLDELGEDIRDREGEEALAKFMEQRRTIGPVVRTMLDESLGTIPVYRLQGSAAKGAARLVLKDVAFTDTEAIAILSPAQALIKIATALIGGLVALLLGWEWLRAQREARREPDVT